MKIFRGIQKTHLPINERSSLNITNLDNVKVNHKRTFLLNIVYKNF